MITVWVGEYFPNPFTENPATDVTLTLPMIPNLKNSLLQHQSAGPAEIRSHAGFAFMAILALMAMPSARALEGNTQRLKNILPPLKNGAAPHNFEELGADFKSLAEPVDVEVLKEWEEEQTA